MSPPVWHHCNTTAASNTKHSSSEQNATGVIDLPLPSPPSLLLSMAMMEQAVAGEEGWAPEDYAWDPYRLVAVHASEALSQQTDSESLVPPVLPGPAVPSAAASRANRAMCKVCAECGFDERGRSSASC